MEKFGLGSFDIQNHIQFKVLRPRNISGQLYFACGLLHVFHLQVFIP